ncbi:MAG: hypothetical protein O7D91_09875 [Planctomycetota bacterium]|nr:hypothetical protein [Planctomycetota bacterium]
MTISLQMVANGYSVSDGGADIKNDPARAFDKTAGHRSDCRA